jgi:pimeloyl-ACP methyl ester carboxylesterase
MLAYEKFGDGDRKVLALHGWLGDERLLDPMRHALDDVSFEYLVPAYRGYGKSAALSGTYDFDEVVSDICELIDDLGWDRFAVLGHSMGGLVAQKLMLARPGAVEKLVGIAPVPASGAPFDPETLGLFRAAASDLGARRLIMDFSTGNRLSSAWLDLAIRATADAVEAAMDGYLTAFTQTDISAQVQGLELPVKLLVGSHDPGNGEEVMKATYLQHFPSASLEVVPGTGHCPIDEAPIFVAAEIERFLGETTNA